MRRARRVLEDLTGRSAWRAAGMLQSQIDAVLDGVALARSVTAGAVPSEAGRSRMTRIEHTGDELRAELVAELSARLVTPLDREDLFRLSRSVDDVLDNLRDYVREIDLYAVRPSESVLAALDHVATGLQRLRVAAAGLARREAELPEASLSVRKQAGRVRQIYQRAMADLLAGPITAEVLKQRELLRRIDIVGLRLGECADALSDALLKRSV